MMQRGRNIVALMTLTVMATGVFAASNAGAETGLNASQLVELAIESNPQIHSMHAQWQAAEHQVLQNYAPADPIFTFSNVDASHGLFNHAANLWYLKIMQVVHTTPQSDGTWLVGNLFLQKLTNEQLRGVLG